MEYRRTGAGLVYSTTAPQHQWEGFIYIAGSRHKSVNQQASLAGDLQLGEIVLSSQTSWGVGVRLQGRIEAIGV